MAISLIKIVLSYEIGIAIGLYATHKIVKKIQLISQ